MACPLGRLRLSPGCRKGHVSPSLVLGAECHSTARVDRSEPAWVCWTNVLGHVTVLLGSRHLFPPRTQEWGRRILSENVVINRYIFTTRF